MHETNAKTLQCEDSVTTSPAAVPTPGIGHNGGPPLEEGEGLNAIFEGLGAIAIYIGGLEAAANPHLSDEEKIGILREASQGRGMFSIPSPKDFWNSADGVTLAEADDLGRAWVGPGYRTSNNGKALISADGLRQYRVPNTKQNNPRSATGIQANFESRPVPEGP